MNSLNRKQFIKKSALLAAGAMLLPKFITAATAGKPVYGATTMVPEAVPAAMDTAAIIDLHCHPSLKMYLWEKSFWKRHLGRSPGENIVHQQEDAHEFGFGNVRGILATHYLIEAGIEKRWSLIKCLWPAFNILWFSEASKIEHEDYSNFAQINQMMDVLEVQISTTNIKMKTNFVIARSYDEFITALAEPGAIPFAHAIEGAHALGRNLVISEKKKEEKAKIVNKNALKLTPQVIERSAILPDEGRMKDGATPSAKYIDNLNALYARGVCLMTLSHFFENDLSWPCEGMSPESKKFPGFHWEYSPTVDDKGLKDVGRDVVANMLDIGMIVDLTHSTPQVRQDVFKIRNDVNKARLANGKHPRPLVFTHVGSREVFDRHDHGMYTNYGFYDVSEQEIKQVCNGGGLIGIIPEIFFLAGSNRAAEIPGVVVDDEMKGIPYIIETMKAINQYTPGQNYDYIGIGTDFDGLATNPKDLYLNRQLTQLFAAMRADPELGKDGRVEKITHINASNLLKYGWGENKIPSAEWPVTLPNI